jgi:AcrR family transcriptional regulator
MANTVGPVRPMRADARRNYERLLDAAKAAFSEHGTDAPLDDIAKRAGVGSGTLYRHFPTRSDLIEAVFLEEIDSLIDNATGLAQAPNADEALVSFLRSIITHSTTYRGLASALVIALHDKGPELARICHAKIYDAGGLLLVRAQQQGTIRGDVDLRDLFQLTNGIALASEQDSADPGLPDRLLALLVTGLRPVG